MEKGAKQKEMDASAPSVAEAEQEEMDISAPLGEVAQREEMDVSTSPPQPACLDAVQTLPYSLLEVVPEPLAEELSPRDAFVTHFSHIRPNVTNPRNL